MPLKGRRAEVQKMTTGRGNSPRPVPMLKNTTKKDMQNFRILSFFISALCLLSCSSEQDKPETPEPKPNVGIAFGGANGTWQDAQTTRGAGNDLETLFTSFRVWGYKTVSDVSALSSSQIVMDGYKVLFTQGSAGNTTSNTADWEYVGIENPMLSIPQTTKYWDHSATSYRFFAYSPFRSDITVTAPTAADPNVSLSFPFEYSDAATATSSPYASRLWLATPSSNGTSASSPAYGSCVTLTFAPIIAKVRFRFIYPNGTKSVTMRNIQFSDSRFLDDASKADTPLRGTITATYPLTGIPSSQQPVITMARASTDATDKILLTVPYEEPSDAIHILKDPTLYQKWYYVPPLANIPYEQGAYTITANISGKKVSATVPAQYMQWKAGCQYTYIFKLSDVGDNITFADLQVEQWLPGAEIKNDGNGTQEW